MPEFSLDHLSGDKMDGGVFRTSIALLTPVQKRTGNGRK